MRTITKKMMSVFAGLCICFMLCFALFGNTGALAVAAGEDTTDFRPARWATGQFQNSTSQITENGLTWTGKGLDLAVTDAPGVHVRYLEKLPITSIRTSVFAEKIGATRNEISIHIMNQPNMSVFDCAYFMNTELKGVAVTFKPTLEEGFPWTPVNIIYGDGSKEIIPEVLSGGNYYVGNTADDYRDADFEFNAEGIFFHNRFNTTDGKITSENLIKGDWAGNSSTEELFRKIYGAWGADYGYITYQVKSNKEEEAALTIRSVNGKKFVAPKQEKAEYSINDWNNYLSCNQTVNLSQNNGLVFEGYGENNRAASAVYNTALPVDGLTTSMKITDLETRRQFGNDYPGYSGITIGRQWAKFFNETPNLTLRIELTKPNLDALEALEDGESMVFGLIILFNDIGENPGSGAWTTPEYITDVVIGKDAKFNVEIFNDSVYVNGSDVSKGRRFRNADEYAEAGQPDNWTPIGDGNYWESIDYGSRFADFLYDICDGEVYIHYFSILNGANSALKGSFEVCELNGKTFINESPESYGMAAPVYAEGDLSKSSVKFSWLPTVLTGIDADFSTAGYEIYRTTASGSPELIATVTPEYTNYEDTGLLPGTRYVYQVKAFCGEGENRITIGTYADLILQTLDEEGDGGNGGDESDGGCGGRLGIYGCAASGTILFAAAVAVVAVKKRHN